jgi:hypothetical protein
MNGFKYIAFAALAGFCLARTAPKAQSQVTVGVGVAPNCPYGYYDYPPYACASYGYYGPEWFESGVFIGACPWFHGPNEFHGHVDNHFDVKHGYKGPAPNRGNKPLESKRPEKITNFKGN